MHKKKQLVLMIPLVTLLPVTVMSCNSGQRLEKEDKEKDPNYQKIISFFNNQNRKQLNILQNNITQTKEPISANKADILINFATEYLNIWDTKIESLYSDIDLNNENFNSIKTKLQKYDKIINTTSLNLNNLTHELLEEIKQTHSDIQAYNELVIEKNKELDKFVNEAKKLNLSNKVVKDFLNSAIYKLFNLNKEIKNPLELIKQIDNNITKLNKLFTFAFSLNNEPLITQLNKAKIFLEENLSINNLSSYNKGLENNFTSLTNYIIENNLIAHDVKNAKDELFKTVESSNISTLDKQSLIYKIQNIYNLEGIYQFQAKLNHLETNQVVELRNSLIQAIEETQLTKNNKDNLKDLLNTYSFKSLNTFNKEFTKFLQIFAQVNNKLTSIETYIKNEYQGSQKLVLNYYKEKAKYNKLFTGGLLDKISLVSMQSNIESFETLLQTYQTLDTNLKQNKEQDSKTLLDHFKDDAGEKLKFEYDELGKKYDLEKYSYSASYTFENTKLFFDVHDNEYINYQITNLELDPRNWNTLNVEVKVILKPNPGINYTYNFSKTFARDVTQYIDKINLWHIDVNFNVNYETLKELKESDFLSLSFEDKLSYFKPKSRRISKFFAYQFLDDFEYKNGQLYVTLRVLFNNQIIREIKRPTLHKVEFWNNQGSYQNYLDEIHKAKIFEILEGTSTTFFNSLQFKPDTKTTHEIYLASDAIKAFNDSYILPKFGKYELFIKDVINIDDWNGTAQLILWYKKDGVEVPIENNQDIYKNPIKINNFKLLNFFDLKPKGKIFTAEDFKDAIMPDQNIINLINSVNESNFTPRLTSSAKVEPDFRLINVQDLIDQKAFINIEYLMLINNTGTDNKGVNHDDKAYVPLDNKYYDKDIEVNATNISTLRWDYFPVWYDVKSVGKRGMSFKLGWIKKTDQSIRYTNEQEYTLINLVNDYQQHHYPEIMVNNIKLSDLDINYETLKTKTADEWARDLNGLEQVIKLKVNENNEIQYKNFSLPASIFKINSIKRIAFDEAYISFKVQDKSNKWIQGNTWYKIKGFALSQTNNLYESFTWRNSNLRTIQDSLNSITRDRVIEPMWDDLLWNINTRTNIASWTFKRKYLEQTLLKPNAKNRNIKFNIHANSLINDNQKTQRIRNNDNTIALNIDLDNLIASKTLKYIKEAKTNTDKTFKYILSLTWNQTTGIEFKIYMEDNSYKIIIDEPESQIGFQETFEKHRAFLILPAAVSATIQYTNDEELEDFKVNQNRFDYNHMEYNQFNQPITIFSDWEYLANRNVYQPNQNVSFKLHEGYKMDAEHMRLEEWRNWDVVENAYLRTIVDTGGGNLGTGGFLSKTNNDPNNATFYYLTNMHIAKQEASNWNDVIDDSFLHKHAGNTYYLPFQLIGSDLERQKHYSITHKYPNVSVKPLWLSSNQVSKDGSKEGNNDMLISVMDLNEKMSEALSNGHMDLALRTNKLISQSNIGLDVPSKFRIPSVPMIWEATTLGFPTKKTAGSIIRRPLWIDDNRYATGWRNYYSHIFTGGGASGSPVWIINNGKLNYFGIHTAGTGGYMGDGQFAVFYSYDTREYNLFGVNYQNKNPLSLQNYRSLSSQILKAHLYDPGNYDLPWFLKQVNQN